MYCDELYPITVSKFESHILIDIIRLITGSTERSEVSEKRQVEYLIKYLEEQEHVNAQTILVENEYVDRYYLEDYSRYYSRCFNHVPKKCARIHFFSTKFDEITFINAVENGDRDKFAEFQEAYLGFAVIRPIPDTFMGRLCLKPYKSLVDNESKNYKLITTKQKANLFGLDLSVETTPFIEQDTVVSECATSVIWTVLSSGLGSASSDYLPSLSTVTEIATSAKSDGSKTFPEGGLTFEQVAVALKYYDLEPNLLGFISLEKLKEIIYAYINSDIPIILGGDILIKSDKSTPDQPIYFNKGKHYVSILGYHCKKDNFGNTFIAHNIDKVYIHDDRIGPFVRMDLMETKSVQAIDLNTGEESTINDLLELNLYQSSPNLFKPESLTISLYHKIRLPYETIKNFFNSFCIHLDSFRTLSIPDLIKYNSGTTREQIQYKKLLEEIGVVIRELVTESDWEITLSNNVKIKKSLSANKNFYTFNGTSEKSYFLTKSLPKYIWQIRFFKQGLETADILIDATAVPQSDMIIGMIAYNKSTDLLFRNIIEYIPEWRQFKFAEDETLTKSNIKPLFRFYSNIANRTDLNAKFGPLTPPRRSPKKDETDRIGNYRTRPDLYWIDEQFEFSELNKYKATDPSTRMIWAITQHGEMVMGEDVKVEDSFAGHPTLTNGKAARVAGEFIYCKSLEKWVINLESGAYCSHLDKQSPKVNSYLNNVIIIKLASHKKEILNFYSLSSVELEKYNTEFPKSPPTPL